MTRVDYTNSTGREIRESCRRGLWNGPTAGMALGVTQANLVVLPLEYAGDFEEFCRRNPKPCPLLEVTAPGRYEPAAFAPGADLRTDLPRYRVYQDGKCADHPCDIVRYWRGDLVGFLIGCSFTFESALVAAGIPVRHVEERRNVPMYRTNVACRKSGPFAGPMVVSMRPMTPAQAEVASRVTAAFPRVHGGPVHSGDPSALGIADLHRPDYGDAVSVREDEIPVFWACGVTPVEAIVRAKPEIAIVHEPGHMFVTDVLDTALRDLVS